MTSGSRPISAVVDTNLFVSAIISERGSPSALIGALRAGRFQLVISAEQRNELRDVLARPKLRTRFRLPLERIDQVIALLHTDVRLVRPVSRLPVSVRDPKDEPILSSALDGNADYLVTGDNDLLALTNDPRLGDLRIVTVAEFLDAIA